MDRSKFLKPKARGPRPNRARPLGRIRMPSLAMDKDATTEVFHQLGFIPWHCEYQAEEEVFDMMGTSPLFDLVPAGTPAPYYEILIAFTPGPSTEPVIAIKVKHIAPGVNPAKEGKQRPALKAVKGRKHGR